MSYQLLIIALIVILVILLLSFLYKSFSTTRGLKTSSIVIIDSRGQHIVSEREFVKFMDKLESIFLNSHDLNITSKSLKPRQIISNKEKYLDKASEELKKWIRNNNNYPWLSDAKIIDPITEEIEGMQGENNSILFDRNHHSNKSFDGPHLNKDAYTTLNDIANHIKQIKQIHLDTPDDEKKSINLTSTHKLLTNLLSNYYNSIDVSDFKTPSDDIIKDVEGFSTSMSSHTTPKMKKNREQYGDVHDSFPNNVARLSQIDISGFRDDDRLATSSNEMERNSAIESMLVKKSTTTAKLTGGRKHIQL